MYESSAYKSKVDSTACGISFTYVKNKRGPNIDHHGTLKGIFPKSESFVSILRRNIFSERQDLIHCEVPFENLIALSFSHDLKAFLKNRKKFETSFPVSFSA